jgi:RES domain-containing protein
MILWRISSFATLDGLGGLRFSARWHTEGRRIVYTADHPASALLELLVHTDRALLPKTYQLLKIEVQGKIKVQRVVPPRGWSEKHSVTRNIGDRWLQDNKSLLLEVPSAILPDVFHTLINPVHPDAQFLKIIAVQHVPLDTRLK